MSDELRNEVNKALADLENNAPTAPRWQDMTSGVAQLSADEPSSRWRKPFALVAAAAVTVVIVGGAVLLGSNVGSVPVATETTTPSTEAPGELTDGVWVLESYTFEGETVDGESIAPPGYAIPYVEITDTTVTGFSGCNGFGSGDQIPQYDGTTLRLGEIVMESGGCVEPTAEPAMSAALWSPNGIGATIERDTMTWATDDVSLTFSRQERAPVPTLPSWPQVFVRLDCGESWVIATTHQTDFSTARDALVNIRGVEIIEGTGVLNDPDPFVWGLDASANVIAGAVFGDVEPQQTQVWTCTQTQGLRPDANPSWQVATYVNQVGIGQTSIQVWGNRFVEMCAVPALSNEELASRYRSEDAELSIWADGRLPDVAEFKEAVDLIRRSLCASDDFRTSPDTSTTAP